MAVSQIYQFTNTIPAGTTANAPATFPMTVPLLSIEWIEWEVPPGARGNVGFWIGSKGQQVIPFASGAPQWIVTDGRAAHWDTEDLPDSGDWQMAGYNVGLNPHTITVRFGLSKRAEPALVAPLPLSALSTL